MSLAPLLWLGGAAASAGAIAWIGGASPLRAAAALAIVYTAGSVSGSLLVADYHHPTPIPLERLFANGQYEVYRFPYPRAE